MKTCILIACIIAVAFGLDLRSTVRDFTTSHPDFGTFTVAQAGICQSTIGFDDKPAASTGVHTAFTSDATFSSWFRNVAGINVADSYTLSFTGDVSTSYTYTNEAYFPLDNKGYGNSGAAHNYLFTTEIVTTFTYVGGETLTVTGNDDIFVFVDGQLVIDLGGVHAGTSSATVNVESLGLLTGFSYDIHIFHANRNSLYGSTLSIVTNLALDSNLANTPVVPTGGRPASICEVTLPPPSFCPDEPLPPPSNPSPYGPAKRTGTCPSDPEFHFYGPAKQTALGYSLSGFNAISFGGFYAVSGDVEGRAAIRGNLNLPSGQYSFGYELRTDGSSAQDESYPYALIVGGNANFLSGSVHPDGTGYPYLGAREDIFVGGTFSGSADLQARVTGNCAGVAGCLDADFDNALAYYNMLQTSFDAVADNFNAVLSGSTLSITCTDPMAAAYSTHITAATLSATTAYAIADSCNRDAQMVFNVNGAGDVTFQGSDIAHALGNKGGYKAARVLYNILGSGKVINIQTEVDGSILSPANSYNQAGMGVVIGQVIVGDMTQVHQINKLVCVAPAQPPNPPAETVMCPAWEAQCTGLDFPMAGEIHSFRDFNAVSFGSYNAATGDVEGRLAVRDNVNFTDGYSIGYELRTANNQPDNSLPYSLVVGRELCWASGSLHPDGTGVPYAGRNENAFVGGGYCASTPDYLKTEVVGDCGGVDGCLDQYFDAAKACYVGFQNTLGALSDNVQQQVQFSALILTCTDAAAPVYVVSLTPDVMAQYTYVSTSNCNFQARWVINIRGTGPVHFEGDSFPAPAPGVVYNVLGSGRTITVTGVAVTGSILAPLNTLQQTGGVIIGKVVVGDVSFALQINHISCPNPGDVVIQTPVTQDTPQDSPTVPVGTTGVSENDTVVFSGGDTYIVTAAVGTTLYLNPSTRRSYAAGDIVTATVDGTQSRVNAGKSVAPPATSETSAPASSTTSSSSVVVASFALISMLVLFF